jgi:hypothetical protein
MLSGFVRFVRPTLGLGLALLVMMLASELRGYAQTACSQKDLRQALIGQNVVTEGVLKNGTALVIGIHARLVIAGARVQENTLFLSLTPRIVQPGMGQPLVASFHFSPNGCDPIAIRSQLSDLLAFPSEVASTVGTHVPATTQAGQNATVNQNMQPAPPDGSAQTACSEKDLQQALAGQNVVTKGVITYQTLPIYGPDARFVVTGAESQANILRVTLTGRMSSPFVVPFHFTPTGCDPKAIRSQLTGLLVFSSDEAPVPGAHWPLPQLNMNFQLLIYGPRVLPTQAADTADTAPLPGAPPLTAEEERLACCALFDAESEGLMRFCKAHVMMTPAHDMVNNKPQPCMWTIIEAAKKPGNPDGITADVLAQANEANEANQRLIKETEQAEAKAREERAKQDLAAQVEADAQRVAHQAEEKKQILEAIQEAIRKGPPPGATIYRGLYIGEPIGAIKPPALPCLSGSYGADEAQIKMIRDHAAEACFLIGGWSVDKIVDLIAGPTDIEMQFLENQYGSPLPGKRRLLDGESYPEWYIWPERKDGTFIAAKRDSGSVQNENPVFFTLVVILKR